MSEDTLKTKESSTAPDQGGREPDHGGKAPDQPGKAPDQGGKAQNKESTLNKVFKAVIIAAMLAVLITGVVMLARDLGLWGRDYDGGPDINDTPPEIYSVAPGL